MLAAKRASTACCRTYGYRQAADGSPLAPLGSHVNPHTAGGIAEGGYLGFAELQYAHMPLPGETLVAFLSDGAAEEQSAAATGFRAGGGPRIAVWRCQ